MTMPPASLWEQYSVIGIVALILLFFGALVERAWKSWTAFRAEEFARQIQRDAELEKQRKAGLDEQRRWQAEQTHKLSMEQAARDEEWRKFLTMQDKSTRDFLAAQLDKSTRNDLELQKQIAKHSEELIRNTAEIADMRIVLVKHDTFSRQVLSEESRERLRNTVRSDE